MKHETMTLARLLDSRRRRIATALVLALVAAIISMAGPRAAAADAVAFGAVLFGVVWAAEAYLCAAARRTLADR